MSQVAYAKNSFNGGELSKRISGRRDQGIYKIGLSAMTGFAPLVEGPAEAMPGSIWVAQAKGPCRLLRFEYNVTQGHVIEASANAFRVYTNDVRLEVGGVPVEVATPWDWPATQKLRNFQSYDVMYCFHGGYQTRQFVRDGATAFHLETLEFENGPFDDRNSDQSRTVTPSALTGDIMLSSSTAMFAATDVGSLFQLEAVDFGDTPQWEPGVTIATGDIRVSNERVYTAVSNGKTGSLQPNHTIGTEWDGNGGDTGVQWAYTHDHYGILKITGYTSPTQISGTVLRAMPFSTAEATWRWRFGSFSDTRGWPEGGCIWKERLCLFKGSRIYLSVAADLLNFATWSEDDTVTADMAVQRQIDDPNAILAMAPGEHLMLYNASGVFMVIPENAAAAFGPENAKVRRINNGNCGTAAPLLLDDRTVHIDRSQRRIYEIDLDSNRSAPTPIDLTRYARQMGTKKRQFVEIAAQQHPSNMIWTVRDDGTMAIASYLDEEQVLGWANRPLANGVLARSIVNITDPDGKLDQIWAAVEFAGAWHVIRMAQWREDGDSGDNQIMSDLVAIYDDVPTTTFVAPHLANRRVEVVADAINYWVFDADGDGRISLPQEASTIIMGLNYPAFVEDVSIEAGGDNGPAQSKMARISRSWVELEQSRGLAFGTPGTMQDLTQFADGDLSNMGWAAEDGFRYIEANGDFTQSPRLRVERRAPFASTIIGWGAKLEVQQK
ncbi:hypothetical protein [Novosphingobium sp.]|uniref:hypothetical protein n=1 Tax=Novosphingobium sp. TaxID=1874826 RepID=UPI0031E045C0